MQAVQSTMLERDHNLDAVFSALKMMDGLLVNCNSQGIQKITMFKP